MSAALAQPDTEPAPDVPRFVVDQVALMLRVFADDGRDGLTTLSARVLTDMANVVGYDERLRLCQFSARVWDVAAALEAKVMGISVDDALERGLKLAPDIAQHQRRAIEILKAVRRS